MNLYTLVHHFYLKCENLSLVIEDVQVYFSSKLQRNLLDKGAKFITIDLDASRSLPEDMTEPDSIIRRSGSLGELMTNVSYLTTEEQADELSHETNARIAKAISEKRQLEANADILAKYNIDPTKLESF